MQDSCYFGVIKQDRNKKNDISVTKYLYHKGRKIVK